MKHSHRLQRQGLNFGSVYPIIRPMRTAVRFWHRGVLLCSALCLTLGAIAQTAPQESQHLAWDRQTFTINGRDVVLIGGSIHYFRIPESEWERGFRRIRADAFNLVDTYVPWFVPEPEENKFNFDKLQSFLDLARKYNLYVVARPGPYINSETGQGGFPRWLSGKDVGFRRDTEADRRWSKHWYDADNQLLFVSCEPLPRDMELPVIRPDADSIRKITGVQLSFSAGLD